MNVDRDPMTRAEELIADAAHMGDPRNPPNAAGELAIAGAALAVAYELRALREALPGALLDALGDDSHLDKAVRVLRDLPDAVATGIRNGIWEARSK
jgi:hypothetical protein